MHLALPLYTIQIYDRVISSGSIDTLVALTRIVAIVLIFQAVLDYLRHRIFVILGGAGRRRGSGGRCSRRRSKRRSATEPAPRERRDPRPGRRAELHRQRCDRAADRHR